MAPTSNVWSSGEAIMYYQELKRRVLNNVEFKRNVAWSKIYKTPQQVAFELLKDNDDRKPRNPPTKSISKTFKNTSKTISKAKLMPKAAKIKKPMKNTMSSSAMDGLQPLSDAQDKGKGSQYESDMMNFLNMNVVSDFPDDLDQDFKLFDTEDGDTILFDQQNGAKWNMASLDLETDQESSAFSAAKSSQGIDTAGASVDEQTKILLEQAVQETQRLQQEESYRQQMLQEERKKLQLQHTATQKQTEPLNHREEEEQRKQREMQEQKERLEHERELERKRREEEERRMQQPEDDDDDE